MLRLMVLFLVAFVFGSTVRGQDFGHFTFEPKTIATREGSLIAAGNRSGSATARFANKAKLTPDGKSGYGVELDGKYSFLWMSKTSTETHKIGGFSVAIWVKPSLSGPERNILDFNLGKRPNKWRQSLIALIADKKFGVRFLANGTRIEADVDILASSKWTHLAGVWEGESRKLYINGVLAAEGKGSASPVTVSPVHRLVVGRRAYGKAMSFGGTVDDVVVTTRALQKDEILALFEGGQAKPAGSGKIGATASGKRSSNVSGKNHSAYSGDIPLTAKQKAALAEPWTALSFSGHKPPLFNEYPLRIDTPKGSEVASFGATLEVRNGPFQIQVGPGKLDLEREKKSAKESDLHPFLGIVAEGNNLLAFRRKGYGGEPEYIFFMNLRVDGEEYYAKNNSAKLQPNSKAHLDIMLKAARSIRSNRVKAPPR